MVKRFYCVLSVLGLFLFFNLYDTIDQFALGLQDIVKKALEEERKVDYKIEFAHLQSKPNSTDLLEQLAEFYVSEKPDQKKIKETEEQLLKVLEKEIMTFVDNLPEHLKKLLPDWKERFEEFKKKINLVKKPFLDFLTNKECTVSVYGICNAIYLSTALGLKPFSVDSDNELSGNMDKKYQAIINETFNDTIDIGSYEKNNSGGVKEKHSWIINKTPLIPFDFIIEAYKYDKKQLDVSETLENNFKKFKENYKKIIDDVWVKNSDPSEEGRSLLLGLFPRAYSMQDEDKSVRFVFPVLNTRAYAYKSFFISGIRNFFDRNIYVRLYEMLNVYSWLALVGSKNFLIDLGRKIQPRSKDDFKASDFPEFTTTIENSEQAQDNDCIKIARYVLQQAQKNMQEYWQQIQGKLR